MLERILFLMKQKKISKNKLAIVCGIPRTTVYSVLSSEENCRRANLETIRPIAEALNTTLDYLITGSKNRLSLADSNSVIIIDKEGKKRVYKLNEEDMTLAQSFLERLWRGKNSEGDL